MKTNSCGASSLSPLFFSLLFYKRRVLRGAVVIVCAFLSRLSFAPTAQHSVKFLPYARACLTLHSAGQMSAIPCLPADKMASLGAPNDCKRPCSAASIIFEMKCLFV